MQLSEAVEIKELFGVANVNTALKEGWRILAVTSSSYGNDGKMLPLYTMGKLAEPQKPIGWTKASIG